MNSTYERTLAAWAKEFRAGLSEEVQRLIAQAKMDLHFGCDEEDFPGFETACQKIIPALSELPSVLYINTDSETWNTERPESSYECEDCGGEGTVFEPGTDLEDICETCDGEGRVEYDNENWYEVDKKVLRTAVVGKELAEYVVG